MTRRPSLPSLRNTITGMTLRLLPYSMLARWFRYQRVRLIGRERHQRVDRRASDHQPDRVCRETAFGRSFCERERLSNMKKRDWAFVALCLAGAILGYGLPRSRGFGSWSPYRARRARHCRDHVIHGQKSKQTIWTANSPVRSACGADSLSSWVWARASAFRPALAYTSPASVQNNR
jgi:hypothetical protein